jgi:hypothetical protein
MRKSSKVILVLAICFLLVGSILGIAGYALGGMRAMRLTSGGPIVSTSQLTHVEVGSSELLGSTELANPGADASATGARGITEIDVRADVASIRLIEGSDFALSCTYDEALTNFEWSTAWSPTGGTLTVSNLRRTGAGSLLDSFGLDFGFLNEARGWELVITYPRGTALDKLYVYASLGNVETGGLSVADATFDLSLGNLSLSQLDCALLTLDLDLGWAALNRCTVSDRASLRLNSGSLTVSESALNNLEAYGDLGDLSFSGTLTGTAYISASLGGVNLNLGQPLSAISYDLSCDMGAVSVNGVDKGGEVEAQSASTPELKLEVECDLGSINLTTLQ